MLSAEDRRLSSFISYSVRSLIWFFRPIGICEGDLMTSDPSSSMNWTDNASGRGLKLETKAPKAEPPSTYKLRSAELKRDGNDEG